MPDLTDEAWKLKAKGDPRAAHRLIRKALREDPTSYRARCIYAAILDDLGWSRRAIEVIRPVVLEYPEDAYAKRVLAVCLVRTNQNVEAEAILSALVAADPADTRSRDLLKWNRVGSSPWLHKEEVEALDDTQADAIDLAIFKFEKYLYGMRYRKAFASLRQWASLQSIDVRISTALGKWALKKGRLEQANRHLMQSIDLDPKHPKVILLAADILAKVGNHEAACRWHQRLLVLPGKEFVARLFLARHAIRRKEFEAADWHIKRVEYLQPYNMQTVIVRTRFIAATEGLIPAVRTYFKLAREAIRKQEISDRSPKKG